MQVGKLAQNEKGKRVASKFCDHRIGNLKLSDPRRRRVRICSAVQAHGSIRLVVASCLPTPSASCSFFSTAPSLLFKKKAILSDPILHYVQIIFLHCMRPRKICTRTQQQWICHDVNTAYIYLSSKFPSS